MDSLEMKFRAHDTFFIRKGWISKGMKYVEKTRGEVFISKSDKPIDVLGIGSNMVKALRYWLQAVGLTKEPRSGKRIQTFTDFGKIIYKYDRYIEEIGTRHLLHYKLASNVNLATSWYFFFNEFNFSDFTRDDFSLQISNFIKMNSEVSVAARSIEDDFNCIISTYVPRYKTSNSIVSPENNIDCPLGEIGLVDVLKKERNTITFKKSTPPVNSFNPWVILAIINDNANGKTEISLNELLNGKNNIGKIFNLDSISMLEILRLVENIGELKIVRTAGLDIINLSSVYTFEECVKKYYLTMMEMN